MGDFKKKSYSGASSARRFSKPRFGSAPRRDASAPLELFDATCARCKKTCEVPFKPNGKKPVLCKECFDANKGDSAPQSRAYTRPQEGVRRSADLQEQIELINAKLDTLTRLVKALAE